MRSDTPTVLPADIHTDLTTKAARIQGGLAALEFEPFFQPIVDLFDGSLVGFEALARWRHPARGVVEPGEFVDIAEAHGLIRDLDLTILEQSLRTFETEYDSYPGLPEPLSLSVNLSASHLLDGRIVEHVARLIGPGLDRVRLQFELTETLLIKDTDMAAHILQQLRALGVSIALDDFGTGYSGLAYLHRLPIDCIKIDRSFLKAIVHSPRGRAIVRSMVGLAQSMGVRAVAEGVESKEVAEALKSLGCRYGQGMYFSAPLPAGSLPAYLDAKSPAHA